MPATKGCHSFGENKSIRAAIVCWLDNSVMTCAHWKIDRENSSSILNFGHRGGKCHKCKNGTIDIKTCEKHTHAWPKWSSLTHISQLFDNEWASIDDIMNQGPIYGFMYYSYSVYRRKHTNGLCCVWATQCICNSIYFTWEHYTNIYFIA